MVMVSMLSHILSGTTIGLDGVLIEVEVDVAGRGFPTFTIVGLASKSVDEAKDRVRTAITNASYEMPDSRITVNLAPADIPKEGPRFDLPIALGILASSGMIDKTTITQSLFIGELSLEGQVRKISGALSVAIMAKEQRIENVFVPAQNAQEAAMVEGITVYPVRTLEELVLHINGVKQIQPVSPTEPETQTKYQSIVDFSEIKGQETAKRALLIAAAGFHNIFLTGVPGAGKTLLSRAFPSLLPPMQKQEMLEVTKIYSVAGLLQQNYIVTERPFRAPHHTTSRIGLIGGGAHPMPGEISLAHRGVLFLDEIPEFPRSILESLRQPLEDGMIAVARAAGRLTFPSRFLLMAASNPCPCGYLGHPKKPCRCLPGSIIKYKKRVSGPLMDRIDLHVFVSPVATDALISNDRAQQTETIREKVLAARKWQSERFKESQTKTNGEMTIAEIRKYCMLTNEALTLMKQAVSRLSLSARAYYKVIKIARTIADLSDEETIAEHCINEALQYRPVDE